MLSGSGPAHGTQCVGQPKVSGMPQGANEVLRQVGVTARLRAALKIMRDSWAPRQACSSSTAMRFRLGFGVRSRSICPRSTQLRIRSKRWNKRTPGIERETAGSLLVRLDVAVRLQEAAELRIDQHQVRLRPPPTRAAPSASVCANSLGRRLRTASTVPVCQITSRIARGSSGVCPATAVDRPRTGLGRRGQRTPNLRARDGGLERLGHLLRKRGFARGRW